MLSNGINLKLKILLTPSVRFITNYKTPVMTEKRSKEFLKERLFRIYKSIKNINIKYQYFREGNLHLAEVTPMREFVNNKEYISMEKKLTEDFNKKFPLSKLIFVSENSLMRVNSPEFSFSRLSGKNLIVSRSIKNYSPYFSLTVTEDLSNLRKL